MSLCSMKTGKLMKENCSKKIERLLHRNKLLFIKIFNPVLLFAMLRMAVACSTGTSLCSSRYQQAASFLQHALAKLANRKLCYRC